LFDGACVFCNRFIRRVIRADRGHFLLCDQQSRRFLPLVQEHGLPVAGANAGTIYLLQHGKAYTRAAAIGRILCGCRLPYSLAGWLLRCIPPAISNAVYDQVALRRHRLLRKKACSLPSPGMQERLLQ
jgi:predicted DCC family thiol-disulfide oxidoreductase YuxK